MKPGVFWSLLFFWGLSLAGCGSGQSDDWNDYFKLFQEGTQYQGRVVHVTPAQMGSLIQVEYQDETGAALKFIETWPSDQAPAVHTGDEIKVYALTGDAKIKEATVSLLKQKRIA